MNSDVLNGIFKRRPARDFLRLYPSEKWKDIIPDIFEIGVLNLKNSFGTLKFTKIDLKNILDELRNYNSSDDNPEEENKNNYKNNTFNNNNNKLNNNYLNESSNYNENNNKNKYINEITDIDVEENNSDINEDNDEDNNNYENNDNKIKINSKYNVKNEINSNNIKISKKDDKKPISNVEVFIPDMKKITNNVKYNRPKIVYNSTFEEIKEKNIENKRNIGYTESKIKYQIMNDKMNHQAMKKRKISNEENYENDASFSFNQNKNNNKTEDKREKNTNKNYLITFDKNLNPEKPIEVQKRFELNNNLNNNILYNIGNNKLDNLYINLNNSSSDNYDDDYDNNVKDYNENKIFSNNFINNNLNESKDKNNYKNNYLEQLNNFKKEKLNYPKYEYNRGFNNNS